MKEHRQTSAELLHELQHLRTSRHGIASGVPTSGATESNIDELSNLSVDGENVHDDENKLIGGHNVIDDENKLINVIDDENKLIGGHNVIDGENKLIGGHNVIDGENDENDNEDGQDCVVGDVDVRGDNKERDKFCVDQTERTMSAAPKVESSGSPNGTSGSTEHVTYATAARAADTDTDGFTRVVYNPRHKQGAHSGVRQRNPVPGTVATTAATPNKVDSNRAQKKVIVGNCKHRLTNIKAVPRNRDNGNFCRFVYIFP